MAQDIGGGGGGGGAGGGGVGTNISLVGGMDYATFMALLGYQQAQMNLANARYELDRQKYMDIDLPESQMRRRKAEFEANLQRAQQEALEKYQQAQLAADRWKQTQNIAMQEGAVLGGVDTTKLRGKPDDLFTANAGLPTLPGEPSGGGSSETPPPAPGLGDWPSAPPGLPAVGAGPGPAVGAAPTGPGPAVGGPPGKPGPEYPATIAEREKAKQDALKGVEQNATGAGSPTDHNDAGTGYYTGKTPVERAQREAPWVVEPEDIAREEKRKQEEAERKRRSDEADRLAKEGVMLAEGGIVTQPTQAILGEREPEAVVPLSKMGQVANQWQQARGGAPNRAGAGAIGSTGGMVRQQQQPWQQALTAAGQQARRQGGQFGSAAYRPSGGFSPPSRGYPGQSPRLDAMQQARAGRQPGPGGYNFGGYEPGGRPPGSPAYGDRRLAVEPDRQPGPGDYNFGGYEPGGRPPGSPDYSDIRYTGPRQASAGPYQPPSFPDYGDRQLGQAYGSTGGNSMAGAPIPATFRSNPNAVRQAMEREAQQNAARNPPPMPGNADTGTPPTSGPPQNAPDQKIYRGPISNRPVGYGDKPPQNAPDQKIYRGPIPDRPVGYGDNPNMGTEEGGPDPYAASYGTIYDPLTGEWKVRSLERQQVDLAAWQAQQQLGLQQAAMTGQYQGGNTLAGRQQQVAEQRAREQWQADQAALTGTLNGQQTLSGRARQQAEEQAARDWTARQAEMTGQYQGRDTLAGRQQRFGEEQSIWGRGISERERQQAERQQRFGEEQSIWGRGISERERQQAEQEAQRAWEARQAELTGRFGDQATLSGQRFGLETEMQRRAQALAEQQAERSWQMQQAQLAANPANAAAMAAFQGTAPWQQALISQNGAGGAGGAGGNAFQGMTVPTPRQLRADQVGRMTPEQQQVFGSYVQAAQGRGLNDWLAEARQYAPSSRAGSPARWR